MVGFLVGEKKRPKDNEREGTVEKKTKTNRLVSQRNVGDLVEEVRAARAGVEGLELFWRERKREEMMRSGLKTERASVFGIAVVEFRRELLTLSLALSLFKSRPREKGRRGPGLRKGK